MGFQLSTDDDNKSSTSIHSRPRKNPEEMSDYSEPDFNPEEENSVFIANQYQHTASVTPSYETRGSSATYKDSSTFPPILMILSVLCMVIYLVLAALTFKKLATGSYTDIELASQLSSYMFLAVIGNILILIDAIIMCSKGNGFGLIIWCLLFQPVYYYKRCNKNGDSSIISTLCLSALIIASVFYCNTLLNIANNALTEMQGQDIATTEVITMTESECKKALSTHGYTIDGKSYNTLTMVESNISNPTYAYVAATTAEPAHISVAGETTINGHSQKIELRFNYKTLHIQGITLGLKSSSNSDTINELRHKMLENTPAE